MNTNSYVYSHVDPKKGSDYETMYQSDRWLQYAWEREQVTLMRILKTFKADRQVRLLDFACGTGRITSFLESHVSHAVGVDVSDSMLQIAAKKVKTASLVKANLITNNVLTGQTFDLITAFRFFPNAEPELRRAVLRLLTTLLAKNGCIVLNNHINLESMFYSYYRLKSLFMEVPPKATFSMRACQRMVADAGLELVRIYSVGLLHLPRYQLSHRLYHWADGFGCVSNRLASFSESPIIVCRSAT